MKNVMTRAWEIAREGAAKFGGKVKEYFQQALVIAWSEIKKGVNKMQVHKWVTARGANVELHAEHVTKETFTDDWGGTHEKKVNRVFIDKVIIDGKVFNTLITRKKVQGNEVLSLGTIKVNGKKMQQLVALPADVIKAVWGKCEEIEAAKNARREAREKAEHEELDKKIKNGYCPKCHSYCWGDCEAN